MLSSFAPAKINLHLHVTGRRDDGYHLLDSLAVFADVGDVVAVAAADELSLRIEGPFGSGLAADENNLVLRAARALNPQGGARIVLTKNLPVASGIGGGSADAAAALRALARLWNISTPLHEIAAKLGADVPVCLARRPALMAGIGEILTPAPALPEFGILLVNPGVAVPTPAVFKARTGAFSPSVRLPAGFESAAALAGFLAGCGNDLEAPAIALAPMIGEVLAQLRALPGCLLARMSGSGATCFALFESPAAIVAPNRSDWWHQAGGLYEPALTDL